MAEGDRAAEEPGEQLVAEDADVGEQDRVARPGSERRAHHAERADADGRQERDREPRNQQGRIDAAEYLQETEDRHPGQQEQDEVGDARYQLAEDDLAVEQVSREQVRESALLLLLGDGPAREGGRQQ